MGQLPPSFPFPQLKPRPSSCTLPTFPSSVGSPSLFGPPHQPSQSTSFLPPTSLPAHSFPRGPHRRWPVPPATALLLNPRNGRAHSQPPPPPELAMPTPCSASASIPPTRPIKGTDAQEQPHPPLALVDATIRAATAVAAASFLFPSCRAALASQRHDALASLRRDEPPAGRQQPQRAAACSTKLRATPELRLLLLFSPARSSHAAVGRRTTHRPPWLRRGHTVPRRCVPALTSRGTCSHASTSHHGAPESPCTIANGRRPLPPQGRSPPGCAQRPRASSP